MRKGDVNDVIRRLSAQNEKLLKWAVMNGHIGVVDALVARDFKDAAVIALENGYTEIAQKLVPKKRKRSEDAHLERVVVRRKAQMTEPLVGDPIVSREIIEVVNFTDGPKFRIGDIVEARLGDDRCPKYLGTIFEVIVRDYDDGRYTCEILAFDCENRFDEWSENELHEVMPAEGHNEWQIGDRVHVKAHRGEKLDGNAEYIWMPATVTGRYDDRYYVKYDCNHGCPRGAVPNYNMRSAY